MIRVLVTCVGSGVGQSVVDSLRHFKDRYHLIGSDRSRRVYPVPDCDGFVELPGIHSPDYLDALYAVAREQKVNLVIPGHDLELEPLAREIERFADGGVQVMVSGPELVRVLRDKQRWATEFRRHTDRVVATAPIEVVRRDPDGSGVTFPAIAKPAGGSASSGLHILQSAADLDAVPDGHIVQAYLLPMHSDPDRGILEEALATRRLVQVSEVSVQLVYSKDGGLLGRFASRNRLKGGVPIEIEPLDDADLWAAVGEIERILEGYDPRGPVNLQGRMTDDGPVFFEMNPRFTGITGNRAQFGFNEVALLADNFVHGTVRPLLVNRHKIGVRQVACRAWPASAFDPGVRGDGARTVTVFGASSWLARTLVRRRIAEGDEIFVIGRSASLDATAAYYAGSQGVTVLDAGDERVPDAIAASDVVVNCLSARPPDGAAAIGASFMLQVELLRLAEIGQCPRFVNISSQSVYDPAADRPWTEDSPVKADEPYAFSKLAMEAAVAAMSRRDPSIESVSLRLARLFGPVEGMRPGEFIHRAVHASTDGGEIEIHGPRSVLDVIDIRDAVEAIGHFIDADHAGRRGEVFNVGTGEAPTVERIVADCTEVAKARALKGAVVKVGGGTAVPTVGMDCSRVFALGWRPRYDLRQSIEDLFDHVTRDES